MSNTPTASTTNGNGKTSQIFVNLDGSPTLASYILLLAFPILYTGRITWGIATIFVGIIVATRSAMDIMIQEQDKQDIRYSILDADDVVGEMEALDGIDDNNDDKDAKSESATGKKPKETKRIQYLASLGALVKKHKTKDKQTNTDPHHIPLLCQQASYIALKNYPNDDEIVSAAISLLALIAKDSHVRKRNKYQADDYGLHIPIQAMQNALERAKHVDEQNEDVEELLAEIQRKACLYLGALTDGDKELELAILIVQEDGLHAILNAANWFRYHDSVINWALWAIFILCYDNLPNKAHLFRLGGINTVCQCLKNIPDTLEVARHGIAILFDMLRQDEGGNSQYNNRPKLDPWELRRQALASGLHAVVKTAMTEFSDSMDIMMMGQEMLLGTGYTGDIPEYQQL